MGHGCLFLIAVVPVSVAETSNVGGLIVYFAGDVK